MTASSQGFVPAGRHVDFVPFIPEDIGERNTHVLLVIDDKNTSCPLSALRIHELLPLRYSQRLLRGVSRQSDTKQGATAFRVLHVDGATVTFDDLSTDG